MSIAILLLLFLACYHCSAKLLAGGLHSFHSVQANGQVYSFGNNKFGVLGDNTTVNRAFPVLMRGLHDAVVDVSSTYSFACLTDAYFSVQCLGDNRQGQLGDATTVERHLPTLVVSLDDAVASVFAGKTHACALLSSGGLRCWGNNDGAALGDGTRTSSLTPVPVFGYENGGVLAVALGVNHTCIVTTSGSCKCVGSNRYYALGDGSSATAETVPIMHQVQGLTYDMIDVSSGDSHACALDRQGGVWCWGLGLYGQLGNGKSGFSPTPVQAVLLGSGVKALFCGPESTMVTFVDSRSPKVFGRNDNGQFGTKAKQQFNTPIEFAGGVKQNIAEMRSAHSAICVLDTAGVVQCIGSDAYGQLGSSENGNEESSVVLVDAIGKSSAGTSEPVTKAPSVLPPPRPSGAGKLLAVGYTHVCSIQWNSQVYCFGSNANGELGAEGFKQQSFPVRMQVVDSAVDISAGEQFTCAVTTNQMVVCVGENGYGQLGDLVSPTFNVSEVYCGKDHACAITQGKLVCWGSNQQGKLGIDSALANSAAALPVVMPAGGGEVTQAAAGASHTCLVTVQGQVLCVGSNKYNQLGVATANQQAYVAVQALQQQRITMVAVGNWHSCALSSTGAVSCWGLGYFGDLGSVLNAQLVTPLGLDTGVVFLTAFGADTCAIHGVDGSASCFGTNSAGQFATGDARPYQLPVSYARGLKRNIREIRVGSFFSCAMDAGFGGVQCVGDNFYNQLGNGFPNALSLELVDVQLLPIAMTLTPTFTDAPTESPTGMPTRETMTPTASPTLVGDTLAPSSSGTTTSVPSSAVTSRPFLQSTTATPTTLNDKERYKLTTPQNGILLLMVVGILALPIILSGRRNTS